MNTYNEGEAESTGRVSIRLEGFPNEESARSCLQVTLKPELAKQLTEVLRTKGLCEEGVFESDWITCNPLTADKSKMPDQALRKTILRGILTKQIAITDGIELTNQASASYIREISTALQDPIVLSPGISHRGFGQERIFLDQKFYPSVAELLRQIAAANKIIDGKYSEVHGVLGNPVSGLEYGAKDSFYRKHERGAIYLSPSGVVHEVHGAIYQKYLALGAEAGFLGFPDTDEQSTVFGTGRFNHFQGGSIYWTSDTGAWEIHGAIRNKWWQLDGDRSYLGYPISDEEDWNGSVGRISHFQRGSIVYRWAEASAQVYNDSVILSTSLSASSVTCSAELWMNSAGDWRYKGHMHNSGFVGFNVTVVSTPQFQNGGGNIFAVNVERHLDSTTSFGNERDDDWDQVGSQDAFIRENWDFIRYAGMRTVMDVDTTFGDIVQLIATGLPIAVGAVLVGAILGGGKVCSPQGHMRRDPYTHQDNPEVTFEVVGKDEQCPN